MIEILYLIVEFEYFTTFFVFFFFSSRRRHTRSYGDWSSDVCSSDLDERGVGAGEPARECVDPHRRARPGRRGGRSPDLRTRATRRTRRDCGGELVERSEERRVGKEGGCRWGGGRVETKEEGGRARRC